MSTDGDVVERAPDDGEASAPRLSDEDIRAFLDSLPRKARRWVFLRTQHWIEDDEGAMHVNFPRKLYALSALCGILPIGAYLVAWAGVFSGTIACVVAAIGVIVVLGYVSRRTHAIGQVAFIRKVMFEGRLPVCPQCEYDQRATTEGRCPECGCPTVVQSRG